LPDLIIGRIISGSFFWKKQKLKGFVFLVEKKAQAFLFLKFNYNIFELRNSIFVIPALNC